MTDEVQLTIIANLPNETIRLQQDIIDGGGEISHVGSRRALDGSIGEWIVVASVALAAFRQVATQLIAYVRAKQILAIKIDDLEIERPTEAQVDEIIRYYIESRTTKDELPPGPTSPATPDESS
jgi:hypothetical protein